MGALTKIDGDWKNVTAPYVKVAGNWKIAKSALTKIDEKWKSWFLQGGINDIGFTDFDNTAYFNSPGISRLVLQTDGKIIATGSFTKFGATSVSGIIRLNVNRSLDVDFVSNIGSGANGTIADIMIQPDGKIIVVGGFTSFNGISNPRIIRLNSDGTRDTAFATSIGSGAAFSIQDLAIQSDGKILLVGNFTTFNGTTAGRIVRLNPDGTRDTAFTTNTGTGANNDVYTVAVQPDGKIVLSGNFTAFNGTSINRIVRLNADGTADASFNANLGSGLTFLAPVITVQEDGKILLGGSFSTFNGTVVNGLVRLNADGTRDTAFTTNVGTGQTSNIRSITTQPDGKNILVGDFTTFNGATVNSLVRLNADGTRDTAFTTNAGTGADPNTTIWDAVVQPDGKIVLGGSFTTFNLKGHTRIVSLNSDGSVNSDFLPILGLTSFPNSIKIQPDGKIIIVGSFTFFNNTPVNGIVRLNLDGNIDSGFTINTGTGSVSINQIAIQSDAKIVLVGNFTTFNGSSAIRIVRLNPDGTRDTAFTTNVGTGLSSQSALAIAIQPDGKIIVGGGFTSFAGTTVNRIVRLNADGTRDTAFTTNTGTGANQNVSTIAIQPDGKIILGGNFTTFNGATVNRIVRLNADGTRDTAFTTNTGTGLPSIVDSMNLQLDGKIILGGGFTTFNGTTVGRIVRLNPDGTRDTAFTTNTGTGANFAVREILVQSNNKIILSGVISTFNGATTGNVVRLNPDGTRDTAFTTNTGTGASGLVQRMSLQPDGKIVIGGEFSLFNNIIRNRIARIGGDIAE
jgi:uncharacterized delta-60 repeat protein